MFYYRGTVIVLSLLVVAVLSACGSGGSSSLETQSPPTVEEQPAKEQPVEEVTCPTIHPYENYMAIGDSLTAGFGDLLVADNVTADGCYEGEGYPPVLINKLNKEKGRAHVVINKGVGGATSLMGSQSVGSFLGGSMHYLVLYGTNDSEGADIGEGVEPIVFKKNMQNIIDQIRAAGKNAYLAKIPPVRTGTQDGPKYNDIDQDPRNKLIQQYNVMIDQLVRENHINIEPPALYGYYKSRPELYSDSIHMNGIGYQRMADLWWLKIKSL